MKEDIIRFLIQVFVFLAAGMVLLSLLYWGARRLKRSPSNPCTLESNSGWTVEQINELHKSGRLTDKQYRSLKNAVIRSSDRPAPDSRPRR